MKGSGGEEGIEMQSDRNEAIFYIIVLSPPLVSSLQLVLVPNQRCRRCFVGGLLQELQVGGGHAGGPEEVRQCGCE